MQRTHVRGALVASLLPVMGCAGEVTAPCDLWTASAIVSGRVTDPSGAAVAGAEVDVQIAGTGPCDGAADWAHPTRVTTDRNGAYSAELVLGNWRGLRCVRATEMASGTSQRGQAEFAGGCDDTRPPGQLTVDLVTP